VFQFFSPSFTQLTFPQYLLSGYGGTDPLGTGAGTLRAGTIHFDGAQFTDQTRGFVIGVKWSAENEARPCQGDSGGPLVINTLALGRLLHTRFDSMGLGGSTCAATFGTTAYSGMSELQFNWLSNQIATTGGQVGLVFRCRTFVDASIELKAFMCDKRRLYSIGIRETARLRDLVGACGSARVRSRSPLAPMMPTTCSWASHCAPPDWR
jgi:hypothetical protein